MCRKARNSQPAIEAEQTLTAVPVSEDETLPALPEKVGKRRSRKSDKKRQPTFSGRRELSRGIRIAIIAGSIVGVIAIAAGIMLLIRGSNGKVNVYDISNLSLIGDYGDDNESYGNVTADNLQTVFLSESQRVIEINVKEGDTVKAGQLIMTYDTTLDALEVDKKALEVTKKELELANLKKDLANINSMKPSPTYIPEPEIPEEPEATGEVITTYRCLEGTGIESDPYIYVIAGEDIPCDDEFITTLLGIEQQAYVVFENRKNNMTGGIVKDAWGVCFTRNGTDISFTFFDADEYIYEAVVEEPEIDMGSGFTAAEIANMRKETQKQITDKDIEVRLAKVEVEQMRLELAGGEVLSEIDGVVTSVATVDDAKSEGIPIVKISAGGGFYVEGTISEAMLEDVGVGDSVTVHSWENNWEYQGEITEIINLPADTGSSYNTYPSYYPFRAFVSDQADLQVNEFVSISIDSNPDGQESFYLDSAFVREDGGVSYVYVSGENGKLEKREIVTGGTLWGSYTRIISGVTPADLIAFPYGKNVREGAKAVKASVEDLWSM